MKSEKEHSQVMLKCLACLSEQPVPRPSEAKFQFLPYRLVPRWLADDYLYRLTKREGLTSCRKCGADFDEQYLDALMERARVSDPDWIEYYKKTHFRPFSFFCTLIGILMLPIWHNLVGPPVITVENIGTNSAYQISLYDIDPETGFNTSIPKLQPGEKKLLVANLNRRELRDLNVDWTNNNNKFVKSRLITMSGTHAHCITVKINGAQITASDEGVCFSFSRWFNSEAKLYSPLGGHSRRL